MLTKSISRTAYLTAADCNAQFEMPIPTMVQTIVEVATDHANELGVGYDRLMADGNAWVLMRLTLQMTRMPKVQEYYRLVTWVESFNRRFSERDFEISAGPDKDHLEVIGHAKTIWTTINSTTRQAASLDGLEQLQEVISHRQVEFNKAPRVLPADFSTRQIASMPYRIVVSDIDTNRHLTSMRYLQLMLDMWPLEFYDNNIITHFEIAYSAEGRYGDCLTVERLDLDESQAACRLVRGDTVLSQSTIRFRQRP